jgi:hypothetical protein
MIHGDLIIIGTRISAWKNKVKGFHYLNHKNNTCTTITEDQLWQSAFYDENF